MGNDTIDFEGSDDFIEVSDKDFEVIDDVQIFDRVLSQEEISQLYEDGK